MPAMAKTRRAQFDCTRCDAAASAPLGTSRAERGLCNRCFGKRPDRRPRELNELSGKQWAAASRSVEQYPDTRSEKQRLHGAAFPMSLARQQIEIYTKPGDVVLDPFVGVGTTLDACEGLGRRGIGIELNPEFTALAEPDLQGTDQRLLQGDARRMSDLVSLESVDLLLTSPPYGSLLRNVKGDFAYKWREHSEVDPIANPQPYSGAPEDLGNLDYPDFLDALEVCLSQSLKVLKQGAYAAWVVKDFRALKQGAPYVNLHGHLIERAERAGLVLWDLRIYDQTKFRPLVCLGYPSRNFYLNLGHSYIVILRRM